MFKIPGRRAVKLRSELSTYSINANCSNPNRLNNQFINFKREEQWNDRFHLNNMKP